ncbi:MAG TPA: hypothetical protein VFT37_03180 [Telluria sp.]|nr:hypothetical protein [Telluria sp.]
MKTLSILAATVLLSVAGPSMAGCGGGHKSDHKMMDTNGDGMISKDEFMKYHESMWDKMKKTSAGTIAVKDMDMMREHHMMGSGKMDKMDKMEKDKVK